MAQLDQSLTRKVMLGLPPKHLSLAQSWLLQSLALASAMADGPVELPRELLPLFQEARLMTAPAPEQVM